jgi:hypothetical protein
MKEAFVEAPGPERVVRQAVSGWFRACFRRGGARARAASARDRPAPGAHLTAARGDVGRQRGEIAGVGHPIRGTGRRRRREGHPRGIGRASRRCARRPLARTGALDLQARRELGDSMPVGSSTATPAIVDDDDARRKMGRRAGVQRGTASATVHRWR